MTMPLVVWCSSSLVHAGLVSSVMVTVASFFSQISLANTLCKWREKLSHFWETNYHCKWCFLPTLSSHSEIISSSLPALQTPLCCEYCVMLLKNYGFTLKDFGILLRGRIKYNHYLLNSKRVWELSSSSPRTFDKLKVEKNCISTDMEKSIVINFTTTPPPPPNTELQYFHISLGYFVFHLHFFFPSINSKSRWEIDSRICI